MITVQVAASFRIKDVIAHQYGIHVLYQQLNALHVHAHAYQNNSIVKHCVGERYGVYEVSHALQ